MIKENLSLFGIKVGNKFFISKKKDFDSYSYSGNYIKGLLFDMKEPKETFLTAWYSVENIPLEIHRVIPESTEIVSYKLKEGFIATEKTPLSVPVDFFEYDGDCRKNSDVFGIYEAQIKIHPISYEKIEFSIEILKEIDDENCLKGFKFDAIGGSWGSEVKQITQGNVEHIELDRMMTHNDLLSLKKCALSSYDSFCIIRRYIKDNIDLEYAEITSDYDFCLDVSKKIKLSETEPYKVDLNFSLFGKKKRPKVVTKFRTDRKISVYKTAPYRKKDGVYEGYPMTPAFTGENYQDLVSNINKFLKELITEINEPLIDCPHCEGMGVINKCLKQENSK